MIRDSMMKIIPRSFSHSIFWGLSEKCGTLVNFMGDHDTACENRHKK